MNRLPDFRSGAVDAILAPLSQDDPCGPALRYDPVFTAIRLAREEDDPSLPMGQWERPLKCADWAAIEGLCTDMLATRSKDLQIAAWLVEAMLRQHGLAGLRDGLRLFETLVRLYWPQLHPVVEDDGDLDARLAPFEWINEALATSVRLHAVLLTVDLDRPVPLTLAAWERMTVQELAPEAPATGLTRPAAGEPAPTRAGIAAAALGMGAGVAQAVALVGECLDMLEAIASFLHAQLGDQAPNLGKLESALEGAARMLSQLYAACAGEDADADVLDDEGAPAPAEVAVAPLSSECVAAAPAGAHWRNRAEAYATLAALADYLSAVEPHSPTPFLIRRAVNWGSMSLPEVIAEIIREEGDVSRLFNVLGIKS
jgi:type VI secretion system protein ImpA